jgi:hypothetical protein
MYLVIDIIDYVTRIGNSSYEQYVQSTVGTIRVSSKITKPTNLETYIISMKHLSSCIVVMVRVVRGRQCCRYIIFIDAHRWVESGATVCLNTCSDRNLDVSITETNSTAQYCNSFQTSDNPIPACMHMQ